MRELLSAIEIIEPVHVVRLMTSTMVLASTRWRLIPGDGPPDRFTFMACAMTSKKQGGPRAGD